jgi:hypothetical protein
VECRLHWQLKQISYNNRDQLQGIAMRTFTVVLVGCVLATTAAARAQEFAFPKFRAQEIDHTLTVGYGVLLVDLNNDRKPDVVVADSKRVIWFENPSWQMHTILAGQTAPDNVAIAPIDMLGKGRTDLVLGAGWKGYNTKDNSTLQWLEPGENVAEAWTLHQMPFEEVALHRVHVAMIDGKPEIFAAPLLGRGASQKGNWSESTPGLLEYAVPADPVHGPWSSKVVTNQFHVMHNFWPVDWNGDGKTSLLVACYEGVWLLQRQNDGSWKPEQIGAGEQSNPQASRGSSEVKLGHTKSGGRFIATIEPWHGNEVVVYFPPAGGTGLWTRKVIDTALNEGHGIWLADLSRTGTDDIIACSRGGKPGAGPGVFAYSLASATANAADGTWQKHVIDDQHMSAEDVAAADLKGDGNIDIVAVGRATHNVTIYWNERSGSSESPKSE